MDDSFTLLLNLPNKALMNVIRNMERPLQLGFSILSKRAMNIVKSLNIKSKFISVRFNKNIDLIVDFANSYKIQLNFQESSRELILRDNVNVKFFTLYNRELYNRTNGWNKPEYQLKDWVDHVLSVFNCLEVSILYFSDGCDQYHIQSIYNIFKKCTDINIGIPFSSAYSQSILNTFNLIKRLVLTKTSFRDRVQDIFIQNYDVLIINPFIMSRSPKIRLNDLLSLNSVVVELHKSKLSDKDLNKFIKHWIEGSNSRMEALTIEYPSEYMHGGLFMNEESDEDDEDAAIPALPAIPGFPGFPALPGIGNMGRGFRNFMNILGRGARIPRVLNENVILNGIDYQIIPQEHERTFDPTINSWRPYPGTFNGGYDIQREDGTTATILITNRANNDQLRILSECRMQMFVWN